MLHKIIGASLLCALVLFAQVAEARRIALVIGIGRYTSLNPLSNPVSDATAIAGLLRANDFEVFAYNNLTRSDMLDAIDAFRSEAEKADVALIYYAGHGMESLGKNVIAPADMEFSCEPKQVRRTVELDKLFEAIQNVPQQIVLIDACRNDPFPQCARGGSSGVGFRGIEVVARGGSRVLVASSTLSGRLAADGPNGGHSPFAAALLARFNSDPRTPLRNLLDEVARDVALGSNGGQTPEVTTRGGAPEVCLAASDCGGSSVTAPLPIPGPAPLRSACNPDFDYQDALRKNTAEAYRAFLARCPNDRRKETVLGLYTRLADGEMWQNVSKENTLSGYIQYQVAFPTGTYIEQAKKKQHDLETANQPEATSPIVPPRPSLPAPESIPSIVSPRTYRVLDTVSQGILNIRTGPGTAHSIVVAMPAGVSDVNVGRCRVPDDGGNKPWCEVQWRGHAGWASSCCMVETATSFSRTFRVLADVSQGILNIRDGPGVRYSVVAAISAGASDVAVGRCQTPDEGGRIPWCQVEWRGHTGWASSCCMVDVKTGAMVHTGE